MATNNLKTTTIRSLFWKLFEQGGTAIVSLVIQVVLAHLISPERFGELAIMLVFVNVGNVIVQSGLNTAIIQSPDATERDYSTVFWMSLAMSIVSYAIVFFAAPAVADFYAMPSTVWPLRVLVLVLIINAYNAIQEAIVARNLDFRKTATATVVAGIVSCTVGVWIALRDGGIWALVIQQLLQQACKCVVLAFEIDWKPQLVFELDRAIVMFRFGWKLLASGLLEQGYQSLSDLLIGKVFTKTDLGYVSQGKKYPLALGALLDGAIQPVMLSAASRVQDDVDQVKRLARRALKTSTFLIIPAMALFAVAAEPIVRIVLGPQWLPSVPFVRAYCLIYAMLPIHTTNLQVLNGMGRSDLFLRLEVIKKIVSTFINAHPNKRVIGYAYMEQVRDILPAVLLTLLAAAAAYPVSQLALNDFLMVLAQGVVMAGVYLLAAWLFRMEEFTYLLNTAREMLQSRS